MRANLIAASIAACLLTATAGGCVPPKNHLIFHQRSVIGLDFSPSPESGEVELTFGYDRKTATFIPKRVGEDDERRETSNSPGEGEENENTEETTEAEETPELTDEAMSVLATTKIRVPWLGIPTIQERFATGEAAITVAGSVEAVEALTGEGEE